MNGTVLIAQETDVQLVEKAKGGDSGAFNALYLRYQRRIFLTCFKIVKVPESAEDATQDTFLRAWKAILSFRGDATFYGWLCRIAINQSLNILRRNRRSPCGVSIEGLLSGAEDHPAIFPRRLICDGSQIERRLIVNQLAAIAISSLVDSREQVAGLDLMNERNEKESARSLGCTLSAAKSLRHRARTAMRKSLEEFT
jgi:RNA polymerase sigma-70 factor (ECF subfamily)